MMTWSVQKLDSAAILPAKKDADDAGWDIFTIETYTLAPGERHIFSTGIAGAFPPDYVAVIKDRSSLGSKGIETLAGVIDAGYRGEWKIVLHNTSTEPYVITAGDRIAQCIFLPVPAVTVTEVTSLAETTRGTGGFGSSGK